MEWNFISISWGYNGLDRKKSLLPMVGGDVFHCFLPINGINCLNGVESKCSSSCIYMLTKVRPTKTTFLFLASMLYIYEVFHKWWYPKSWLVYNGKSFCSWMIWRWFGGTPMTIMVNSIFAFKRCFKQDLCLRCHQAWELGMSKIYVLQCFRSRDIYLFPNLLRLIVYSYKLGAS